jgi:drug/metabolite transporter (DMT)-like permease
VVDDRRAALGVTAVAAAWGLIGIFVRQVPLPALAIVAARCWFATVTIAVVNRAEVRRSGVRLARPLLVVALGAGLAVHWGFLVAAQQRVPVGTVLLITYLAPVLVAVLAPVVLHEHVPRTTYVAALVAFVGVGLLARPEGGNSVGLAFAVASGVTYAFLTLFSKKALGSLSGASLAAWQLGVAGLVLVPFVLDAPWAELGWDWLWLVGVGVVLTGLLGPVYLRLLHHLPAATVSTLTYVEAVSAVLLGWLFLGEQPTAMVVVGGALVVGAGIMVIRATARTTVRPAGALLDD